MPPAFPFPRIQAPAKAETPEEALRDRGLMAALKVSLAQSRPRAFGWCGCTEREFCQEHAWRAR